MSDNNQDQAQQKNADQQETTSFYDVFNETIPVESSTDYEIPFDESVFNINTEEDETDNENGDSLENAEGNDNQDPNENQKQDLIFEDEIEKPGDDDQESEDDLIEKLKAKGYDVSKQEQQNPNQEEDKTLERLNNVINDATSFINSADDIVVKEKLKADLMRSYESSGRQNLINSEEFNIDLEAEFSEYESNPTTLKLFADNVRRDVKDIIRENTSKKEAIESKRTEAIAKEQKENKLKLQEGIKSIVSSGLFGLDINNEQAKEVYQDITSGEFAKSVNSNPNLVAELAFYIKNREEILKSFGQPSYGEGVKSAVDALEGKASDKSKSPLAQAMNNNSSSAQGNRNRKSSWGPNIVKDDEDPKKENGTNNSRAKSWM